MSRIKPLPSPRPRVKPTIPSPGSDAALAQGCRCPVLDNVHGSGYMGAGAKQKRPAYVINGNCPLHGKINQGK